MIGIIWCEWMLQNKDTKTISQILLEIRVNLQLFDAAPTEGFRENPLPGSIKQLQDGVTYMINEVGWQRPSSTCVLSVNGHSNLFPGASYIYFLSPENYSFGDCIIAIFPYPVMSASQWSVLAAYPLGMKTSTVHITYSFGIYSLYP